MSKFDIRLRAMQLRRAGKSIRDISSMVQVSKSTASLWCKNIYLTKVQREKLEYRRFLASNKGRLIGAKNNRTKKLSSIRDALQNAKKEIGKLSKRDLLIAGTALYWAEGSKTDSTFGFSFINSDPYMVLLMKRFLLEICSLYKKDIVCIVQINKIHEPRIDKVLKYWSRLLQLPSSQFNKPYYVNVKPKKVYENYDNYYGILRLRAKKSSVLKYKMLGLIESLKSANLSE